MSKRSCVLLGASGLVGGHLLRLLADDPSIDEVRSLTRRALGVPLASKVREIVIDFDDDATYREHVAVDTVFCCLGTTMKKAGSKDAFRKVDFDAALAIARAARAADAKRYSIVTAVGADAKSSVFYNKVKGETEQALRDLAFPHLDIFHPSMILGERNEPRPAEHIAATLMRATRPLFGGALKRYRAIEASDVARAMLTASRAAAPGEHVYEGKTLFEVAEKNANA